MDAFLAFGRLFQFGINMIFFLFRRNHRSLFALTFLDQDPATMFTLVNSEHKAEKFVLRPIPITVTLKKSIILKKKKKRISSVAIEANMRMRE
jgi:hypothetical protein